MRTSLLAMLLMFSIVVSVRAEEPTDVALMQLIATPERFDGKLVRVIGFLNLEFEGNALYLHREDYEKSVSKNAVWVDIPRTPPVFLDMNGVRRQYVIVEGYFNVKDSGHMGMFSGALTNVRRMEKWR